METCRLCLAKKKSDELAISLQDNVERLEMKIPFQSFLEYHCRIWFDSNPDLPQRLCKDCKFRLEMFIDFCNNVVRNQKDLILNTREKYLSSNNTENAEIRENNANNNIQINQPLIDRDETPIIQLISDTEDDGLLVDLKEIFPPIEDVQAGTLQGPALHSRRHVGEKILLRPIYQLNILLIEGRTSHVKKSFMSKRNTKDLRFETLATLSFPQVF